MKRILSLIFVFTLLLSMSGCFSFVDTKNSDNLSNSYYSYMQKLLGIDLGNCEIVEIENTHGGFLGDGEGFIKVDCSNDKNFLEQIEDWKSLPLSENLQLIMYGGTKDGVHYSYELAENYSIPAITNGYYYFVDRYSEATDTSSDDELFDRYSFNFTLAMYDCDTATLYYYEFDT